MISSKLLAELKTVTEEEQKILDGQASIDRKLYMNETENTVKNAKMLTDGKVMAIRPHTRFIHFPEHCHDYIEIVYMCSGSTTHVVDGETIELKEGELLFLGQSARQEILPAGMDDIAVNFIVLPVFFDRIITMLGEEETPLKSFIVDSLRNKQSVAGYLHFKVADILPVQNLMENLIWTLIHGAANKRSINQTTMGLLFLHLINLTKRLHYGGTSEEVIVKTLGYIEENYKSGSLSELSKLLHYDISSISREIKNKTGKTYTELVQDKRLSQAAYLLKNTNLTIEEIAGNIGYESTVLRRKTIKVIKSNKDSFLSKTVLIFLILL